MEFLLSFLQALYDLSNAMAPYILFGLLFAGFLHEVVPDTIVKNHLGKNSFTSVFKATLFGIPLPVCSCGVIPLATSLKKSGASNGATLSFLISTPITGVDSILATYGMFGWLFTLYRVFSSMLISIVAGFLANIYAQKDAQVPSPEEPLSSCHCETEEKEKKTFSLKGVFRYAFGTLLEDIAMPLLLGLLFGALISVTIPEDLGELLLKYSWLSYVIAIAIAVPMYVCATASLPIAAGLMLAGVSPGAAFVFLSAGPATNTVTIGVVKKMLGSRTLFIYLTTIVIGSVFGGLFLDYLLADIDIKEMIHMEEDAGVITMLSSLLLWVLLLVYTIKPYFQEESKCCNTSCSSHESGE